MESLFVSGAETAAEFFRWADWRVAESRVPFEIGRQALGDVPPRGFDAIVEALLRDRAECRRRRRGRVDYRLRVRAPGQHEWEQQCGQYYDLSHIHLEPHRMDWMSRLCCGATLLYVNPELREVLHGHCKHSRPPGNGAAQLADTIDDRSSPRPATRLKPA